MDNIGKMYNSSSARYSVPRQMPSHTESFYRALQETSRKESYHPKERQEPIREAPSPTGGILSALGLSGGGSLGGSLGSSLSSLLKKIGDDDILLLLMIVILLNENKQDDYLILIILGVILLT